MGSTVQAHLSAVAAIVALLIFGGAVRAQAQPENTGPNSAIVRSVTGHMTFRNLADGRVRGGEDFRLIVHPDGTRHITISKDFLAVNAQQTIVARVDRDFRPLETYAAYWTASGFKGAIFVAVRATELRATATGPKGHTEDIQQVPQNISVVHHGEVTNGWYLWSAYPEARGDQTAPSYILNAGPRDGDQVAGVMRESHFHQVGPERVTTPAGTFDTLHYVLSELDMWIAGEDRLLVRQVDAKNGREYVLTKIEVTGKTSARPEDIRP